MQRRGFWAAALAWPAHGARETLRLGATQWAPYAIEGQAHQPGLAHELLTLVLARLGFSLEVSYLPWSRALLDARSGQLDGLLTAAPSEAQGLLLTAAPTCQYEVVFMTDARSSWRFDGRASLGRVRLGVVADYGYGEPVDQHLADPAQAKQVMRLYGQHTVRRLIQLVRMGRIDALVEDRLVLQWAAARGQFTLQGLRGAGSLKPQPVFMALHPRRAAKDRLLERLNAELIKPSTQTDFARLRRSYLSGGTAPSPAARG